jgi:DNA-binding NtrC family response regulator
MDGASGGTIFLDDIADLQAQLQNKLVRRLQESQLGWSNGGPRSASGPRVIAATSHGLDEVLRSRRLREDLFYRLSAFTMYVPPLRERREEIPLLAECFMGQLAQQYGAEPRAFTAEVLDACQAYSWPGNLRELEAFVKRYLVIGDGAFVLRELTRNSNGPRHGTALDVVEAEEAPGGLRWLLQTVKGEAERNAITQALEQTRWNRRAAARLLKVSYRTLLYKIQQYHMSPPPAAPLPGTASKGEGPCP